MNIPTKRFAHFKGIALCGAVSVLTIAAATSQGNPSVRSVQKAKKNDKNTFFAELVKDEWYDLDNDGRREFYYGGFFRINTDSTATEVIRDNGYQFYPLVNLGLDAPCFFSEERNDNWKNVTRIYKIAGIEDPVLVYSFPEDYEIRELRFIDIDNDGDFDIWPKTYTEDEKVASIGHDGSLLWRNVNFMTPAEYYDYIVTTPGSGLGSGLSVVGGGEGDPGAYGSFQQVDVNNDGLMDYILPASGEYLMNIGNGSFVRDNLKGKVYFRDFDGDGLNDMLSYNDKEKQLTLTFQKKEGEPETRKLVSGMACGDLIWCKDFDKDGDIDILVPFNGARNDSQGYLIMLENQGDGTFKKKEHYIEGAHVFLDCVDIYNNGNYEVFFLTSDDKISSDPQYVRIYDGYIGHLSVEGIKVQENATKLSDDIVIGSYSNDPKYNQSPFMAALDANNTGRMAIYVETDSTDRYGTRIYKSFSLGNGVNTRPEKMASPKIAYNEDKDDVEISWNRGNDKETASLDLTYELRIGTAPDKCDILWTDALPDGRRRNFSDGNCGFSTMRRLNTASWPEGKIYVSVQAIDGNNMGSEFSDYAVFEKKTAASDFNIESENPCAVSDSVSIRLMSAQSSSTSYKWDFDGAEIINATDSCATVRWMKPGKKSVSLTTTSASGKTKTITKEQVIIPARLTEDKSLEWQPYYSVDLDGDGINEFFSSKFYEADENGVYGPLKRLFNNNINIDYDYSRVVDINRDGLPDLFGTNYKNGKFPLQHVLNEGDKYMEIEDYDLGRRITLKADFDNDGFVDELYGKTILQNAGDYKSFENSYEFEIGSLYFVHYVPCDFDGDSFIDMLVGRNNSGNLNTTLFRNLGDGNFEAIDIPFSHYTESSAPIVTDLDSDGKPEIVCSPYNTSYVTSYSDYIYVLWGDGTQQELPAPTGYEFANIDDIIDLDNNGYPDIIITAKGSGEWETFVLFFNSDRTYQLVNLRNKFDPYGLKPFFRRADGKMGWSKYIVIGPDNSLPTAPSGIKMEESDDCYVFTWNPATDAETPSPALKYNVSLKYKGKTGEHSYIWSPLNDGKNGVPVPSCAQLLVAPKFAIPKSAVGPGELEFKVQAVDYQNECGDFSETYEFSVSMDNFISGPTETMVGKSNAFRIFYGIDVADIDFGPDAVIEKTDRQKIYVSWTSNGEKTISYGTHTKTVFVHQALEAYFYIPDEVYRYANVDVNWDNLHNSEWTVEEVLRPGTQIPSGRPEDNYRISYTQTGDHTGYLIFGYNSYYKVRITHTLTESYGSDSYSREVKVVDMPEVPTITLVDIDETTNRHRLHWSVPEELQTNSTHRALSTNIYKETSEFGVYEFIGKTSLNYTSFVDENSDPDRQASRYRLSYNLNYGETQQSVAHQPIHLQINQGGPGTYNLYWGKYEGRNITTYRILRGQSRDALECIAEVSGNQTSYTDFNVPENTFYAIEIVVNVTRATETLHSRSNIVSIVELGVEDVISDDSGLVVHEKNHGEEIEVTGISADEYNHASLMIHSMNGQLLAEMEVDSSSISLATPFPSGVYIITINGKRHQTTRFIKH